TKGSTPPMYSSDSPATLFSNAQPSSIRYCEMNRASAGIICTTRIAMISPFLPRNPNRASASAAASEAKTVTTTVRLAAPTETPSAPPQNAGELSTPEKFSRVGDQGNRSGEEDSRSLSLWKADLSIQ